ncbi:cleavage and polyadenylation specificity factor subunit 4-like [Pollicipes pollicipes]|uniref:cleavage and polyadenylation specificity factor subunit 4-like n=1 Tax=Pollicipes pollicipes TaxID=41117 RepID=UPI001884AB3F|nr:cleavage and polyadenylation specificity factor subunit 4-like [Pollicipes pollicipes]XP_037093983.1 cleavage and polyadenylation specificity factor subunit 4-like [Pollicipes pollicipes]XP_037093984.1 cleavage and polyadenylation specificity factor subunit 4-like [Pollicipes pollicipes]XP_037093985.1 cleavage and polyadenylation specificity factor subunit 4-like [Pollicipes pollicipes]XP_037094061.1 cleavage and polyadenylation specificity factor subunit 4-like [Pollicipes pollicipes]XP_03
METLVANVDDMVFDIEVTLREQLGAQSLPFAGMDKSMSGVCNFFAKGRCTRGDLCPFRHLRGDRSIVCKHWLRGLCKKGDSCEFLHEYDMTKMPECYFYAKFNACHNKECPFLHIDPETKQRDCPWYDRGFCRHGPLCRNRHVRRVLCLSYLAGFCPAGAGCRLIHPRFELPQSTEEGKPGSKGKSNITCHYCGEVGHKVVNCFKMSPDKREAQLRQASEKYEAAAARYIGGGSHGRHDTDRITCYKCGEKGHFANRCTHGAYSFLSSAPPAPAQAPGAT